MKSFFKAFSLLAFSITTLTADPLSQWTWRHPVPHGSSFNCIAVGKGNLVAGGDYGLLMKSSDGRSWDTVPVQFEGRVKDIIFVNDQFVAITSYDEVLKSSDGQT